MKITDRNTLVPISRIRGMTERHAEVEEGRKRTDRVSLSNETQQLKKVDAERIAAISEAIADGEYKLDLKRLAEAMVSKEIF